MREGMENESDENNEPTRNRRKSQRRKKRSESEEGETETVEATEPKHKLSVPKMKIIKIVNNALTYENDIEVTH